MNAEEQTSRTNAQTYIHQATLDLHYTLGLLEAIKNRYPRTDDIVFHDLSQCDKSILQALGKLNRSNLVLEAL